MACDFERRTTLLRFSLRYELEAKRLAPGFGEGIAVMGLGLYGALHVGAWQASDVGQHGTLGRRWRCWGLWNGCALRSS